MRCGVFGRWRAALGVLVIAALLAAPAAPRPKAPRRKPPAKTPAPTATTSRTFPGSGSRSGDTCVEFTNTLNAVYQNLMRSSGSLPAPPRRGTASTNNPRVTTFTYSRASPPPRPRRSATSRPRSSFRSSTAATTGAVVTTLSEGTAALAGATVGYTDSVMNFWDGSDFQFSATAPSRTVGVVRYEHEIFENSKLGLSLESGVRDLESVVDRVCADLHRRPGARRALALRNRPA